MPGELIGPGRGSVSRTVSVVLHPPRFRKSRARRTVVICSTPPQVSGASWGLRRSLAGRWAKVAGQHRSRAGDGHALCFGTAARRRLPGVRRAPHRSCGTCAQGGCLCAAVVVACGAGLGPASLLLLTERAETPIFLGVAEAVPVEGERQVVLGVHVSAFRDAGCVGLPTWVWPDPVHRPVWDRTDVTAVCLEPLRERSCGARLFLRRTRQRAEAATGLVNSVVFAVLDGPHLRAGSCLGEADGRVVASNRNLCVLWVNLGR